jgi:3-oxoacyl-[acyl-carrier-protein] synthase II
MVILDFKIDTIEEEFRQYLQKGPSRISPFLIPMLIVNEASGHVAITNGLKGPNSCVATACASGSHAIGDAFKILERGDADVMVSGGIDLSVGSIIGLSGVCAAFLISSQLPNGIGVWNRTNSRPSRCRKARWI